MSTTAEVLEFWFGPLAPGESPDDEHRSRWFRKSDEFDAEVRERFAPTHQELLDQGPALLGDGLRDRLAAIIVLDQFSRNMFRGQAHMYSGDELAVKLTYELLDRDDFDQLAPHERGFVFMPLMHAEDLDCQERCVELCEALDREVGEGSEAAKWAYMHRDIVKQFGRFPHRNEILGRETTSEEAEFLDKPGSSF